MSKLGVSSDAGLPMRRIFLPYLRAGDGTALQHRYSPRRMRRACSGNPGPARYWQHAHPCRRCQFVAFHSFRRDAYRAVRGAFPPKRAGNTSLYPFRERCRAINGQRVLQPERTYAADRMSGCIDHFIAAQHTGFAPKVVLSFLLSVRASPSRPP